MKNIYTPKVVEDGYALFAAKITECSICHKLMVKRLKFPNSSFFPMWRNNDQDAQMTRAGFVYISDIKVDDNYICVECKQQGKADFKCELCDERKPTSKIQESFGNPSVFLCRDCYETVPAKIWDEKCDELEEEHRYDFY